MKLIGKLTYWSGPRLFGFVEVRTPFQAGYRVEKFFLHDNEVIIKPEEIRAGQFVRFVIKSKRPKVGPLPYAGEAEIYETMEQLQEAEKVQVGGGL